MSIRGNCSPLHQVGNGKIRMTGLVVGNGTGTPTAASPNLNREFASIVRTSKGLITATTSSGCPANVVHANANVLHVNAGRARLRASVKSVAVSSGVGTVAVEVINEACPPQAEAQKAADAAANTTTAEYPILSVPADVTIEAVDIFPMAGVTADNTNFATLTLKGYDAAGANGVSLATLVTNVAGGDWTALTRKAMTLTGTTANLDRVAQSVLTLTVAKAAAGVQLPALTIRVTFNRLTDLSSSERLYMDITFSDMSV